MGRSIMATISRIAVGVVCVLAVGVFVYERVAPGTETVIEAPVTVPESSVDGNAEPADRNDFMRDGYEALKQEVEDGYARMQQQREDFRRQ